MWLPEGHEGFFDLGINSIYIHSGFVLIYQLLYILKYIESLLHIKAISRISCVVVNLGLALSQNRCHTKTDKCYTRSDMIIYYFALDTCMLSIQKVSRYTVSCKPVKTSTSYACIHSLLFWQLYSQTIILWKIFSHSYHIARNFRGF